jgi:hypothetical protein
MELTREHFCAIIFHNFRRGLSQQECINELNALYNNKAPSYSIVKICGRCSLQDEFREGCPKSVDVPENINAVLKPIEQDRHVTNRGIKESLGISMTSINKILHDHLAIKNISY